MTDRITLTGLRARGRHGVLAAERELGQEFSADVVLHLDTRAAAAGDDLTRTVNYAEVAREVVDVLAGPPVDLVETVAATIAERVLAHPRVLAVDVTVHKPQAPVPVPFADVTVHVHRRADDADGARDVVVALGANLGDVRATLAAALTQLAQHPRVTVAAVSPLLRSQALTLPGAGPQPDYLNAVAVLRTDLPPRELLALCQGLELGHGRVRGERWGARPLDLDLVAAGALTWQDADLTLPHPRAHERAFVLAPWARVQPEAVLPGLGPVAELAADLGPVDWVAENWWEA
ncbi:2-amino-4-hydroxy-6-hydroxymethyldihydropteridine diphosphokinase [Georgenia satyanarayanai]|uniref:2-amino-4-hydroxy-6- hydroxymethyldihydropteridine diphosphokinase n=1 Tax=Georgenia satyanarayanai TaxID=860221 RepID=UPI00203E7B5B|nr:2-amino-4-hydroxy-6-hydroxymethyldihydropteridine diphosphokinase [Georgenia satyanarayanai]MCM3660243.1 2-amino-4-hydroxy-6-hydroxymethyldihydropteridine diphosphokinase [Georgenia satyanarayanai]